MQTTENLRYVSEYLPTAVRQALNRLPEDISRNLQEIRLRADRPVCLTTGGQDRMLSASGTVTQEPKAALHTPPEMLLQCFQAVVSYSVHSHEQDVAEGFVTLRGGCRVGVCGTAVRTGREIRSIKRIGGLNFRIAGEQIGTAETAFRQTGHTGGILVAGSPGSGKTTFLRDYCRLLGNSSRTALIDERGEIAAVYHGVPQHDIGVMTDVLDGYPRAAGILTALRVLNPVQILCDELLTAEDSAAVLEAVGCGVQITASAHAGSFEELHRREILAPLLKANVFRYCVMLVGVGQVQSVRRLP
ncbi:MAG: hypothetical protein K6F80_00900 [Oscillospiraceae bacterium]|nr:hypothetical protein [Oscillospiraceae bacterium]